MKTTIMRQINFCAGHRLLGHEGKCANLHGHNYRVQLYISAAQLDGVGRVVDFAEINRHFKSWIDQNWDHGVLVWQQDTELIDALKNLSNSRLFVMPDNPTAENMARYLLLEIGPTLLQQIEGYRLSLDRVVVWENDNSFAEVVSESAIWPRPTVAGFETVDLATDEN